MYIQNSVVTIDEQKMVLDRYYPKEDIILDEDSITGLLTPVCFRTTKSVPISNLKLTIETAENGYIVKHKNETMIVPFDAYNSDSLEAKINNFLNHDVEVDRELKDSELIDETFIGKLTEMNDEYAALKEEYAASQE